jgi:hypothetical protein
MNERPKGKKTSARRPAFSVLTLSGGRPESDRGGRELRRPIRVSKSHSPERIIDNWESELEVLHDPVDPAAFRRRQRGPREGKPQGVGHLHSFNDGVDLVPPLRSFRLPPIKHDAVLNLSESEFKRKKERFH